MEERAVIQRLHELWSRAVDGAAFSFINALQLREKAGKHNRTDIENYVARWRSASVREYYSLPPEIEMLNFPHSGVFQFPTVHPTWSRENDTVHVEIWPGPEGKKSPAMILLHGFMSVSDVGYRLWAQHLNTLGWTALFFHLPYHYGRRPRGTLSGEICISSNLIRTAEAIRQGVMDLRWVCQSLRAHGAKKIGCWATSYGGWMASLLCVVEKCLDTAWLIEPITDAEHAIWESPAARTMRRQLAKRHITRETIQAHMRLVCPSFHQPVIPPEQILLLAGVFDRISPVSSIRRLSEIWKGSHYSELQQGHVGYQLMPASWRLAREYMPQMFLE